jgi:glutathione S-transferase
MSSLVSIALGVLLAAFLWERRARRTRPMVGGVHEDIVLPHTQPFELYHNAFSLCSKKVRLCLAELAIPHAAHHIDLIETGRYENLGRRFLVVNPAALVPVLVHHGHPVYESHDIIAYAARHATAEPGLIPSDRETRARMQTWIDRSSLVGDDPVQHLTASAGNCVPGLTLPLFAAMIRDIPLRRIGEGLLFHRLRSRPLLFVVLKMVGLARLPSLRPARRVIRASRREMARHLDALEAELARHGDSWVVGRQFTLADVSWAVVLERLREACWVEALLTPARPRTRQYWVRIRTRPSYAAAILACDHPSVRRGRERVVAELGRNRALRRLYGDER